MLEIAFYLGKIIGFIFDLSYIISSIYFIICFPCLIYSAGKRGFIQTIKILIK